MPVTVADIMALPVMERAYVVAGRSGLHKSVRWVHIADVRDIARLLQGGELVLTTGLPVAGPADEQRAFIHELSAAGAAGLVLELVRQFHTVPAAMVEAADEVGLPVIAMSQEVPFVKVTEAAHTLIVNRNYAQVREAEAVGATLNGIALRQEGVKAILQALAEVLGNPVLYLPVDPTHPPVMHPSDLADRRQLEPLRTLVPARAAEVDWPLGGRLVPTLAVPVLLGHEHSGTLCVPQLYRRMTELDTLVVDRAATTTAFEVLRQHSMRQQWQMSTGELLEDILASSFRNQQELRFRARELGIDLEHGWFAVATVQVTGPDERSRVQQKIRAAGAKLGSTTLMAPRGDRVRVLVGGAKIEALQERIERLVAIVEAPAGVGRPFQDLMDAPGALEQAEYTLALRLRYPNAGFGTLFDSTGTYRLLLTGVNPDELTRFVEDELGPLLDGALPDNGPLLHTLRLLLDTGLNMAEAARQLHLTRQALYYRKERLEALLGGSLAEPEKRLSLGLALRGLELLQLKGGGWQSAESL